MIELVDIFTKKSYGYFDNINDVPVELQILLSMIGLEVKEIKDFDQYINEKE